MQNRQAEIKAIREAKLNGIHMIDFGAEERKAHQSYFYDDENGTYVTNVYEPMSEKMLDYRNRKEDMIGKIPADQRANITRIGRGKTNKIANNIFNKNFVLNDGFVVYCLLIISSKFCLKSSLYLI